MNGGPVGTAPGRRRRPRVVRIEARGEEQKILQVAGNLFVCSRANGSCCCGWAEKGRMPFDNSHWSDEWERRRIRAQLHLTFSGCLGPCAAGNNALLQLHGRSIWFKDLNQPALAGHVFDYIEAMLEAGSVLPVPAALAGHVYERYLTPDEAAPAMTFGLGDDTGRDNVTSDGLDALDGLDPVCFMTVDPATTRHTVVHEGRTFAFCAPSCKKMFLADPAAYLQTASDRA